MLAIWLRLLADGVRQLPLGVGELLDQLGEGSASSSALRSPRWIFSTSAISSAAASLTSRISTGTMQAGALGRPPMSLAGDDLMTLPVRPRPHHQRLQQTFADRLRQLVVERLVVEAPPRIVGGWAHRLDRQMLQRPDVLDERPR